MTSFQQFSDDFCVSFTAHVQVVLLLLLFPLWGCDSVKLLPTPPEPSVTATGPSGITPTQNEPPTAILTNTPSSLTALRTTSISVSGDRVASYRFALDGAPYSASVIRTLPIALSDLEDGEHVLLVLGQDEQQVSQDEAQPTRLVWTVDTLAPLVQLSNLPPPRTTSASTSITVSGDQVVGYQYELDRGPRSSPSFLTQPLALTGIAEGEHELRVYGIDGAGNSTSEAEAAVASWTIDRTAPTAVLRNCPASLTGQSTVDVRVEAAARDFVSYSFALDTGAQSNETPASQALRISDITEGAHTLRVWASDDLGNRQAIASECSWQTDLSLPNVQFVREDLPSSPTNATSIDVGVVANFVNVTTYRYSLDGAPWSSEQSIAQRITASGLMDGPHELRVIGKNTLDVEQPFPTSYMWDLDLLPPTFTLSPASLPSPTRTASVDLALQVNSDEVVDFAVTIQRTGAGCPALESLSFADVAPNGSLTFSVTNSCEGSYVISVVASDALGNASVSTTRNYVVDRTPPGITLSVPPSPRTNAASTAFTAGTAPDEVVTWKYQVTHADPACGIQPEQTIANLGSTPIIVLNPLACSGLVTLRVYALDGAGNTSATLQQSYIVDRVLPVLTVSAAPTGLVNTASTSFTVASDETATITTTLVYENCAGPTPAVANNATAASVTADNTLCDGDITLTVTAMDDAGNQAIPAVRRYRVLRLAPTGAVGFLGGPDPLRATRSDFVEWVLRRPNADTTALIYEIDNGAPITLPLATDFASLRLPQQSEGLHTLRVCLQSPFGPTQTSCATRSFTVLLDTPAAPSVQVPSTRQAGWEQTITATIPPQTTLGYRLRDASNRVVDERMATTDLALTFTGLADGTHTLDAWTTNLAGRKSAEVSASWVVDHAAPRLQIFGWSPSVAQPERMVSTDLQWRASVQTTDGEAPAVITYSLDHGAYSAPQPNNANLTLSLPTPGWHSLKVKAVDEAGNASEEEHLVYRTTGVTRFYLAANGSDTANDCTAAVSPCLTISHVLLEIAAAAPAHALVSMTSDTFSSAQPIIPQRDVTFWGGFADTSYTSQSGITVIDSSSTGFAVECSTLRQLALVNLELRRGGERVDPLFNAAEACAQAIVVDSTIVADGSFFALYLEGAIAAHVSNTTFINTSKATYAVYIGEPSTNNGLNSVTHSTFTGFPFGVSVALDAAVGHHPVHVAHNLFDTCGTAFYVEADGVGTTSPLLIERNEVRNSREGLRMDASNPLTGAVVMLRHNEFGTAAGPLRAVGASTLALGARVDTAPGAAHALIVGYSNQLRIRGRSNAGACVGLGFAGLDYVVANLIEVFPTAQQCTTISANSISDTHKAITRNTIAQGSGTALLQNDGAVITANHINVAAATLSVAVSGGTETLSGNLVTADTCFSGAVAHRVSSNQLSCRKQAGTVQGGDGLLVVRHNEISGHTDSTPSTGLAVSGFADALIARNRLEQHPLTVTLGSTADHLVMTHNQVASGAFAMRIDGASVVDTIIDVRDNYLTAQEGLVLATSVAQPISHLVGNTIIANVAVKSARSSLADAANNLFVKRDAGAPGAAFAFQSTAGTSVKDLLTLYTTTLNGFVTVLSIDTGTLAGCIAGTSCTLGELSQQAHLVDGASPLFISAQDPHLTSASACSILTGGTQHDISSPAPTDHEGFSLDIDQFDRTLSAGTTASCVVPGVSRGFDERD